jgi:(1->4)-alpha-D-glucan 1-alpha-D-glucosylmutase
VRIGTSPPFTVARRLLGSVGDTMPVEPRATYRLQLRPGFGFAEAARIADYLADLGISHVYCSPYLQATPGSTHGYDIVDHGRVSDDLGGPSGHRVFCDALRANGLGQLIDIVPNHMAIGPLNPWWWDVLENGPSSPFATFFDVEWASPEERLRNKVLLPILGDHYGRVIESGEIRLRRNGGALTLHYNEHVVPVAPRSLTGLFADAAERCGSSDLAFIADALEFLPLPTVTDRESVERRNRDKQVLYRQLERLCGEQPPVCSAIDDVVAETNADSDKLDDFLARQNCRLAYWRSASRDLGYRRFFDVTSLVALRVEDDRVFAETHALILRWLREGVVDGVRIDHPDGLRDPQRYFERLRAACPAAWIVVEKILSDDEQIPQTWPVDGTTGYEFLNLAGGLFIDPQGENPLTVFYAEFTGETTDYAALVRTSKHRALRDLLGSELNRLTALLLRICEQQRRFRDYTRHEAHEVLRAVLACFPVYRTYVRPDAGEPTQSDLAFVTAAVDEAKTTRPDLDPALFDFVRDLLLLRVRGDLEDELACRFQQLSGPVMAKGGEDTALYNFNRLVALNDVGGAPDHFGTSTDDFHRACGQTHERWPRMLLATSTHDTKRSEDVRARLATLSEIPDTWAAAVRRWAAHNERYRRHGKPDRNTEYLFYQTVVGAWPFDSERATAYMEKASREAKAQTSWNAPDPVFDDALRAFVTAVLSDAAFLRDLEEFIGPLVAAGRINSLAQTLVKLTAPGVPDIYQGTELWDLSLVDPDNRRAVDFEQRRGLLAELSGATPESVSSRMNDGLPKLWVIRHALHLRRARPAAFDPSGDYRPLAASGARSTHVVAFLRNGEILTLVPRWTIRLAGRWGDTEIDVPSGRWRNVLTSDPVSGGKVAVARLLSRFPVCLLVREEPS